MSPEGVVLGADSTSSAPVAEGPNAVGYHYLNHNQKLYEIGDKSTIGAITWGLGGLSGTSHRTLFARLADSIPGANAASVEDVAKLWATQFFAAYSGDPLITLYKALHGKTNHDPNQNPPNPGARTADEERTYTQLTRSLKVGFCIAGYWPSDRTPKGFGLQFDPLDAIAPTPTEIPMGNYTFAGAPNMIKRLINGADDNLRAAILSSGKWNGTDADLTTLLTQHQLGHPLLPIRDAIDFVHTCIYSTIKAIKFSNLYQICGGPIELAVITTDRKFRWVRHKAWDAAIAEGEAQ